MSYGRKLESIFIVPRLKSSLASIQRSHRKIIFSENGGTVTKLIQKCHIWHSCLNINCS